MARIFTSQLSENHSAYSFTENNTLIKFFYDMFVIESLYARGSDNVLEY